MRSPLLTLCAAAAACAVTAAPAYPVATSGAGTTAVRVTPGPAPAGCPAGPRVTPCGSAAAPAPPAALAGVLPLTRSEPPGAPAEASARGELSSTSAVGLVLAGGAVLVIAGQLLRLRLRLRRERQGDAADDR
ncbi:hypothetical protein [Streptomyces lydicus]|uniref:hypothetical protein n=1 Tax=Streptomyces lydicus TaxID=47763 RepID=UPI0037B43405